MKSFLKVLELNSVNLQQKGFNKKNLNVLLKTTRHRHSDSQSSQ